MIPLYKHQRDAIKRMSNGCILNGDIGSGKSRTALAYYYISHGGDMDDESIEMVKPPDLYIITTARKRDTKEWEEELIPFLLSPYEDANSYENKVVIDSWNNIKKYVCVTGAFFIFDEDKVTGYGTWAKTFLKIARTNEWIILSASPGDCWKDYITVFIANGFYKNKTQFEREHVVWNRFTNFPSIDRYISTGKLLRLRRKILVDMEDQRETVQHHINVWCEYDRTMYKDVYKTSWNPFKDEPIKNAAEFCQVQRQIVGINDSRQEKVLEIMESCKKAIIFYNFDFELEILREIITKAGIAVSEWNGHKHQDICTDSESWAYLVQYNAGAEAWNCILTDTIIFFSENYSYKIMKQAAGRIDRMNTLFRDLYYYHLKTHSSIELAIQKALAKKKKFNESKYYGDIFGKE